MNRLDLNKIADRLAQRARTITASVADFYRATPTMARVVVALNTLECKREDLYDAVCATLNNQARPIEGTFRVVSSFGKPAMVGYVALNREVRPYEEATAKKMKALASNMLMDTTDDSLWDVRTDASGNKMLCRQSQADLSELLVTARVRQQAPKLANIRAAVNRGDFVCFVDPKSETARYGYVLATDVDVQAPPVSGLDIDTFGIEIMELPDGANIPSDELRGDGEMPVADRLDDGPDSFIVPASMVIEAAYLKGTDVEAASARAKQELSAPANSQSKEAMRDYYKTLYSYAPDYYAELKKQIEDHAGI